MIPTATMMQTRSGQKNTASRIDAGEVVSHAIPRGAAGSPRLAGTVIFNLHRAGGERPSHRWLRRYQPVAAGSTGVTRDQQLS
jgi:hypothetical protein